MHVKWFEDAVQQVGMDKLLKGQDGYALPNPYWDTPTETTQVFFGITKIFGDNPQRMAEFIESIKAVSRDPDYSWTALYYVNDVMRQPAVFGVTFDLQAFVGDVLLNVRRHEHHLRKLKRWLGSHDVNGCWSSAEGMLGQIEKSGAGNHASNQIKAP